MPPGPKPIQIPPHDVGCVGRPIRVAGLLGGDRGGRRWTHRQYLRPADPLVPVEPLKFLGDGRALGSAPFEFQRDAHGTAVAFTAMNQKFTRVDPGAVPDVPPAWARYTGVYGPAFIPLVISIRHGHLYAMIENELDYRMIPATQTFRCPPGMYREEHVVFLNAPMERYTG